MAKTRDTATEISADSQDDGEALAPTGVRQMPKEMRPLHKEIARLGGYLSLARTACYSSDPVKVLRALRLLESALFAAKEVADLLAPASSDATE